ncbi:MAG: zf-TFIIB domain-containing protein [Candidatus Saccharimonadales bacterium]
MLMYCPVCNSPLQILLSGCYICPKGEGALVTAGHLLDQNEDLIEKLKSAPQTVEGPNNHFEHVVVCPSCSSITYRVNYGPSNLHIDTCLQCHYRWIDRDEFKKIKDHHAQLRNADYDLLMEIEKQMSKLSS